MPRRPCHSSHGGPRQSDIDRIELGALRSRYVCFDRHVCAMFPVCFTVCLFISPDLDVTAVLRVVLRIVTAPLHMRWAEDVRLVCCRGRSSNPPLGLASYHDRGRGDRNMSRIWCAPLGHHMPLLPPPSRGRFIAKTVSMSRTLARRVQSKTQGHMLWP